MKINQIIKSSIIILAVLFLSLFPNKTTLAVSQIDNHNSQLIPKNKTIISRKFCANIDDGNVVFQGEGRENQQGIYLYKNGYLTTIANQNTPLPEGTEKFTQFDSCPVFDRDNVVFIAEGNEHQQGIYISMGGFLSIVANSKTRIPNGEGTFTKFGSCLDIDNQSVVFVGYGQKNQQGIYISQGGLLSKVADRVTQIPGGKGTFTSFASCATLDNEKVVFWGYGANNQQGIYIYFNDSIFAIADIETPIPRGRGSFTSFGSIESK